MSYKEERRAYWRTIIDKHTESGMSAAAFCKQHEINAQRFYFWRRRFHRDPTSAGFIRLVPTSNSAFSGVRISLDHGITLEVDRGFDPLTLKEALNALRALGG